MPYTTVTLAQLKIGMQERWDGVAFWTDEEARLAINESLRLWNLLVGRWATTRTLSTVAGQVEYALGATLIYGARVSYLGVPLQPTSLLELDLGRPTWRSETTVSGGDVPTTPTLWAPVSLQQIAIWPADAVPHLSALAVGGVAATPVLVEDADTVDIGEELHDPLLDFALHVASFKEGGQRFEATLPYFQAYLQAAAQENSLLKANKAYRRYAGLDFRRPMQLTKDVPTQINQLDQAVDQAAQKLQAALKGVIG